MQNVEDGDIQERIRTEIRWCLTYEEGKTCRGAGARKMRQVCIYCKNYIREEGENDEKGT